MQQPEPETLLKITCAVLNSSVAHWFLSLHAYKYRAGYNRVEVDLLRRMPMPDPAEISIGNLSRLLGLVDRACEKEDRTLEGEIDELVAEIFHLTEREREEIMGTGTRE
jgi:hypothetical protein